MIQQLNLKKITFTMKKVHKNLKIQNLEKKIFPIKITQDQKFKIRKKFSNLTQIIPKKPSFMSR